MADDKEKTRYLRQCAIDGKMPKRTDLSFSDRLKYCHLRLFHEYPDDRKIEELVGRSTKQLGRYIQGADIPFLVLAKLCEYSRVPIEWVVENEVTSSRETSLPDFVANFWNTNTQEPEVTVQTPLGQTIEIRQVRKLIWNITHAFWTNLPRRTKPDDVAAQFVEMFDYLVRQDIGDDAAAKVIEFGAERLKRASSEDAT